LLRSTKSGQEYLRYRAKHVRLALMAQAALLSAGKLMV